MLGDISGLEKIYIVCGYTDMRKSIDGLSPLSKTSLRWIRRPVFSSCSVEEDGTGLKPCSGNQTVRSDL